MGALQVSVLGSGAMEAAGAASAVRVTVGSKTVTNSDLAEAAAFSFSSSSRRRRLFTAGRGREEEGLEEEEDEDKEKESFMSSVSGLLVPLPTASPRRLTGLRNGACIYRHATRGSEMEQDYHYIYCRRHGSSNRR